MADSIDMNRLLRAFMKADGCGMGRVDPDFELYFDDDGDIIFNDREDWFEIGTSNRWRDLFEFTVKHVNKEWL